MLCDRHKKSSRPRNKVPMTQIHKINSQIFKSDDGKLLCPQIFYLLPFKILGSRVIFVLESFFFFLNTMCNSSHSYINSPHHQICKYSKSLISNVWQQSIQEFHDGKGLGKFI